MYADGFIKLPCITCGVAALQKRPKLKIKKRIKRAYIKFWMHHAGHDKKGKIAAWMATLSVPPYYGRSVLANIGSRGFISPYASVSHESLRMTTGAYLDDGVLVYQDKGGGSVNLAENVRIYRHTIVQTGKGGSIFIGKDTAFQPRCQISAYAANIRIGEKVQIAPNCSFFSYNHGIAMDRPIWGQELTSRGDIVIGDDVWIGVGATILDGVNIGEGAVVAAGAIVRDNVDAAAIVAGIPAKVVGFRR